MMRMAADSMESSLNMNLITLDYEPCEKWDLNSRPSLQMPIERRAYPDIKRPLDFSNGLVYNLIRK